MDRDRRLGCVDNEVLLLVMETITFTGRIKYCVLVLNAVGNLILSTFDRVSIGETEMLVAASSQWVLSL